MSTILLIAIVTTGVIIEYTLSPRIDKTIEGETLLWYGRNKRKFIKL